MHSAQYLCLLISALNPIQVDNPPYAIANNNVRLPLSFRAIPVTARHYDGSVQYDTHNIYGLSQAAATHRALNSIYKGKTLPLLGARYLYGVLHYF